MHFLRDLRLTRSVPGSRRASPSAARARPVDARPGLRSTRRSRRWPPRTAATDPGGLGARATRDPRTAGRSRPPRHARFGSRAPRPVPPCDDAGARVDRDPPTFPPSRMHSPWSPARTFSPSSARETETAVAHRTAGVAASKVAKKPSPASSTSDPPHRSRRSRPVRGRPSGAETIYGRRAGRQACRADKVGEEQRDQDAALSPSSIAVRYRSSWPMADHPCPLSAVPVKRAIAVVPWGSAKPIEYMRSPFVCERGSGAFL